MSDKTLRSKTRIILVILLILQCISVIWWANRREAFFWDEYYTFEGSRGLYTYWNEAPGFYDNWRTRAEFREHLTVRSEELFINRPVSDFVHELKIRPEWYYTFFNLMYSFSPGKFSMWPALYVHMAVFALCTLLMYAISKRISESEMCALVSAAIYAFTTGCIKTALLLRTYMISTFIILIYIYLQLQFLEEQKKAKIALDIAATAFLLFVGFRFHFFNLMLMGIFTILLWVYALINRKKIYSVIVGSCMLLGIIGVLLIGNGYIQDILNSSSNIVVHATDALVNPDIASIFRTFGNSFSFIYSEVFYSPACISVVILVLALVYAFICHKRSGNQDKVVTFSNLGWVFALSALIYLLTISVILVEWRSWRYFMTIYPLFHLGIIPFFFMAYSYVKNQKLYVCALAGAVLLSIASSWYLGKMNILYPGMADISAQMEENYSEYDGVTFMPLNYLYEAAYIWPESQRVYIAGTCESMAEMLNAYEKDDLILYANGAVYDEVVSIISEQTDFGGFDLITQYPDGYSDLYILMIHRQS